MSCYQRRSEGASSRSVRETQQQREKRSSNERRWMSDEVGGADVRDRVLAGGARAMANVRSRTAAPPPPPAALPLPRPIDRFATGRRCPERVACEMRRTESVALAAAGVISGRTSASGRLYVLGSRRLIRSPGRLRAEGCGWDGRGVVSTVRGSARHGRGQGAAARRHSEQQQLSTWCTGRGGEAAGGERAAGRRRRTLARDPSTRAACVHALRAAARVQVAKGSACAECEMRRRRAAGRRRRTSARDPSTKAA